MDTNVQVRIRALPLETLDPSHFELVEGAIPELAGGEVLVRNHLLSLDPYMRKRLADAVAGRVELRAGDLMMGRTVGEVFESRDPAWRAGDWVLGWGGWQRFSAEPGSKLERIESEPGVPLAVHLGVLGRPGITAWLGVMHVARLQAGECMVVSSAAGAVGSIAGQIGTHLGARVVGIAGGAAKCVAVESELGFAACIDYKSAGFESRLREATPQGVDVDFENVGGPVFDATLDRMKENGRIALCGLVGQYHSGPPHAYRNLARVLDRGLSMTGFRIDSLAELHARARGDLVAWLRAGAFQGWETVTHGLQNAPAAFIAMLEGRGRGKTLVQLT